MAKAQRERYLIYEHWPVRNEILIRSVERIEMFGCLVSWTFLGLNEIFISFHKLPTWNFTVTEFKLVNYLRVQKGLSTIEMCKIWFVTWRKFKDPTHLNIYLNKNLE